jgi:site-specific recombinase XerD
MEDFRLETMWKERLIQTGWSVRAASQIKFSLAASTLCQYNKYIQQLHDFCHKQALTFPPKDSATIAQFLCVIADDTKKPRSHLRCAQAAISKAYEALGKASPAKCADVQALAIGLVKAGTQTPRTKSTVMPIAPFNALFTSWSSNAQLTTKQLRLKAITLLALTLMLRPSDAAPRAMVFDPETNTEHKVIFTRDQVCFREDGSARITLFGIKNDGNRSGFEITVPRHENPQLDPVGALHDYMQFTSPVDNAVFVSLKKPYTALGAQSIANILEDAIELAGLGGQGFSAKSFRCTGATAAIEAGQDPNIVMKMGRWKTESVFYEHYVHSRTPANFTANILEHD